MIVAKRALCEVLDALEIGPNHALLQLQRTAVGRRSCNRRVSWPPSLSFNR